MAYANMIGDGTVPYISLRIPMLWQKGMVYENKHEKSGEYIEVVFKEFVGPKMSHKGIMDESVLLDFLASVI